jgi:hypothetical protein
VIVRFVTGAWSGLLLVSRLPHQQDGKRQVREQGSQPADEGGQHPGRGTSDVQTPEIQVVMSQRTKWSPAQPLRAGVARSRSRSFAVKRIGDQFNCGENQHRDDEVRADETVCPAVDEIDVDDLVQRADCAMYRVKCIGRNAFAVFDSSAD